MHPTPSVPERGRRPRLTRTLAALLLLGALTSGCLEQLSTTRIPGGAARNFFYFLVHNEQADANTYWAPGHVPTDAQAQITRAAAALQGYTTEVLNTDAAPQADGAMIVTLSGYAWRKTDPPAGAVVPLLRARLIELGPGWRLTEFTLLCCTGR
ncbi:MAG TPA: hypothetical protein VKY74_11625 [Chloroflexia bacterium]|nr:hypothetical protein [Chloroflexia bacterium]